MICLPSSLRLSIYLSIDLSVKVPRTCVLSGTYRYHVAILGFFLLAEITETVVLNGAHRYGSSLFSRNSHRN